MAEHPLVDFDPTPNPISPEAANDIWFNKMVTSTAAVTNFVVATEFSALGGFYAGKSIVNHINNSGVSLARVAEVVGLEVPSKIIQFAMQNINLNDTASLAYFAAAGAALAIGTGLTYLALKNEE